MENNILEVKKIKKDPIKYFSISSSAEEILKLYVLKFFYIPHVL